MPSPKVDKLRQKKPDNVYLSEKLKTCHVTMNIRVFRLKEEKSTWSEHKTVFRCQFTRVKIPSTNFKK